jgi:nucleoid DNA-binding protein
MPVSLFKVSNLLIGLLREHNRVSLPGIGAFKTEERPATFIRGGQSMLPPSKTVAFRIEEVWNDGLLEAALAENDAIPLEEAKQQLAEFTDRIHTAMQEEGRRIEFPDFGILRITADGDYLFEKDDDLNLSTAAFGLPEIDGIEPLTDDTSPEPIPEQIPIREPVVVPATIQPINVIKPTKLKPIVPPTKKEPVMDKTNRYIIIIVAIILLAAAGFALHRIYHQEPSQPETAAVTQEATPESTEVAAPTPAPVVAVATPAPVQTKTGRGVKSRKYHVIIGAYADKSTAQEEMDKQRRLGVCNCELIETGGSKPYKISAFRYSSSSEAKEMLDGFKRTDAEYLSAWVERF